MQIFLKKQENGMKNDGDMMLPAPDLGLGVSLMKALERRRTKRKWRDEDISQQDLANLLWCACGITREETKRSKSRRTVPSGRNSQTIQIYVALPAGLFKYNEKVHGLELKKREDVRKHISTQKMMQSAPAGLIYVSDYSRLKGYVGCDDHRKWFVAGTETGFVSQNVYLYCAAAGLNTAIIGLVNREALQEVMGLDTDKRVVYTQAFGYA
jgi:SagB-type dehydrogenase family enzyme